MKNIIKNVIAFAFFFLSQNKKQIANFLADKYNDFYKKKKIYYKVKPRGKIIANHKNFNLQVITENHDLMRNKIKLDCLMDKESSSRQH